MVYEFRLPDTGEGVAEGEVVKWLVKEGTEVKENQPLVEIMTDKVNVEIPSPKAGTILKLMAREGEVVKVGQVLIVIKEKSEIASTPPQTISPPEPNRSPTGKVVSASALESSQLREILATPATRKLARDLGVDLTLVHPTGPGGRITDEDVRSKMKGAQVTTVSSAMKSTAIGPEERISLRGLRRKIAERMMKSQSISAQVTHVEEIDMTELVQLREKTKAATEKRGIKLTYIPFIIKALVPALKQFPYLNATLDDEKQEIVLKKYYNIGIATATEQGLLVPVVRNADHKTIIQLAEEVARLSEKARAGQLTLDEVQGGTFTITNIGGVGGLFATPILNWPEVGILGVYKITKRPIVRENQVIIRDMTNLSISFDHRVLDGEMAANFMNLVKQHLEDPKMLLIES